MSSEVYLGCPPPRLGPGRGQGKPRPHPVCPLPTRPCLKALTPQLCSVISGSGRGQPSQRFPHGWTQRPLEAAARLAGPPAAIVALAQVAWRTPEETLLCLMQGPPALGGTSSVPGPERNASQTWPPLTIVQLTQMSPGRHWGRVSAGDTGARLNQGTEVNRWRGERREALTPPPPPPQRELPAPPRPRPCLRTGSPVAGHLRKLTAQHGVVATALICLA